MPAGRCFRQRRAVAVRRAVLGPLVVLNLRCGDGTLITLGQTEDFGSCARPSLVAPLSTASDPVEAPTMTSDELELYFTSASAGTSDIWVSTRATASDAWGVPAPVSELNSAHSEQDPAVSSDGLRIWFASDRISGARRDIWFSSRKNRTAEFLAPSRVSELSTDFDDRSPAVNEAETLIFLASDRPGGQGDLDLYVSSRASPSDVWSAPTPVAELDTGGPEQDPFISSDGLDLYFAAGDPLAITVVQRPSLHEPFSQPTALFPPGASSHGPTLSHDLRRILFSSDLSGIDAIYEACTEPLPRPRDPTTGGWVPRRRAPRGVAQLRH